MPKVNFSGGFTLVELLVVVSIIAILSSIGYASFRNASDKGRDASRKADLKAISGALISYYSDHDYYPPTCSSGCELFQSTSNEASPWIPELTSGSTPYIQKLPKDPRAGLISALAKLIPKTQQTKYAGEVAPSQSLIVRPNAAGSFAEWQSQVPSTGSHWDKTSTDDGDSSYVLYTGSGRKKESYGLENPTFSGTVDQVNLYFRTRLETSGFPTFGYGIRLGASETRTTQQLTNTTYQLTSFLNVSRPGGGSWTTSDINSIEAFIDVDAGERVRLTEVYVEVIYTPPPGPPPPGTPQPPPSSLDGDCNGTDDVYCYIVSQSRSTFILWARLDNTNDNEAIGKLGAICNYTPPTTNYNYCVEAPK